MNSTKDDAGLAENVKKSKEWECMGAIMLVS